MASEMTRTRLLDAAEKLLASTSYDDLKVRAVCAEAGANPAAVHYHFGSREALVTTLLEDRLGPIWATPLGDLTEQPATVRDVVDAICEPLTNLADNPRSARNLRLLGQFVLTHPNLDWTGTWFHTQAWVELLRQAVPIDEATARRRWRFAFTVLMTELARPTIPSSETIDALADFITAGLSGGPTA